MCANHTFNQRLSLDTVDRDIFATIIDFIEILEWKRDDYIFEIKADELNKWYEANKNIINVITEMAKFLRIRYVLNYIQSKDEKNVKNLKKVKSSTNININNININNTQQQEDHTLNLSEYCKTKNFQYVYPPKLQLHALSLELPVDINLIKKNATKNFIYKGRFNTVLNEPMLNKLIDSLISDSFWFVVCFFQSSNEKDKKRSEDLRDK